MRTLITLTAAAPLALLAACGDTTSADESRAQPMEEAQVADLNDATPEPLSEVPENALDEVDYAGTYSREGEGGVERLTLNSADDTYEYTAPDGTVRSGSFARMDDNRRLSIEDFDGQAAYFSIADGAIYRLESAEAPADQITVAAQYRRDDSNPAQQTGPGATTDNVADRRNNPG